MAPLPEDSPAPLYAAEPCPICGYLCTTQAGLMSHMHQKHQYGQKARAYAYGSCCRGCGYDFHSRALLIKHLAYRNTGCLPALILRCIPMTHDEQRALDKDQAAEARRLKKLGFPPQYAEAPPVRLIGPVVRSER